MSSKNTSSIRDHVFEAISYFRYRGASIKQVDSFVRGREPSQDFPAKRAAAIADLEVEEFIEKRGSKWFLRPVALKSAHGAFYPPTFEDMDFVILFVATGKGSCDLPALIGGVDFVSHCIPRFDEMYGALDRLDAAGLIKWRRSEVATSARGAELYEKSEKSSKNSMYEHLDSLQRLMLCPCCGVKLNKVTWRIQLNESEYHAALKSWLKEFESIVNNAKFSG